MVCIQCARTPIKKAENALRESAPPQVLDDIADLREDLRSYLQSMPKTFQEQTFTYRQTTWSGKEVLQAYQNFLAFLDSYPDLKQTNAYLNDHFKFYEVYGSKAWGDVFVTGYFEPLYQGRRKAKAPYLAPARKLPEDLVWLNLRDFAEEHPQLSPHFDYLVKKEKGPRLLRGRLVEQRVVPYPSREEITKNGVNHKDVIVWLDPIDHFFLQIQGSGTVQLDNGEEFTLAYAGQNGHDYVAIGRFLTDQIPLKEMTATKIDEYLRGLSAEELQQLLNKNPSYVFFQKREGRPLTSQGTPVIDGRSIATDSHFFPKGLLAYLDLEIEKAEIKIQRIVFNQDSGGAINGPGRVDLFWGRGKEAGRLAGLTKDRGKLWFLLPRKDL
tara:strand:- start:30428 stop:31576 length:1149 start_codon:yes stop_codon:yes gene_type:complete